MTEQLQIARDRLAAQDASRIDRVDVSESALYRLNA